MGALGRVRVKIKLGSALLLSLLLSLVLCSAWPRAQAQNGATLNRVRARGFLLCGIDRSEAEYSGSDEHGNRAVFDLDLCKAVAVAALGKGAAVRVTYYADDVTSVQALVDGKADVIASLGVKTKHEAAGAGGVGFTAPVLYDAVGLLVPHAGGIRRAAQLSGKKICFLTETEVEDRLHLWFTAQHLDLLPFPFQEEGEMEAAFVTRNCAALGGDLTRLAQTRASTGSQAAGYDLLPETLGDDTLAMAYRRDDLQWMDLVKEVRDLLVRAARAAAEDAAKEAAGERGMGSEVAPAASSALAPYASAASTPSRTRAGGLGDSVGRKGIGNEEGTNWKNEVIGATGDYRDIFERDLGAASPLRLPPGTSVLAHEAYVLEHNEAKGKAASPPGVPF